MMSLGLGRYALAIGAAAALLTGCGGSQPPIGATGAPPPPNAGTAVANLIHARRAATKSPIEHLIVVIQQDRSFDNLFAGYPGANAPTKGLTSTGRYVRLRPIALEDQTRCIARDGFGTAYDNGKMDGWNLLDEEHPRCPYTRVQRRETRPYWNLARRFALADEMFSSTHIDEHVDQLYLIAGTTKVGLRAFGVGPASDVLFNCESPPGTKTSLLLTNGRFKYYKGPFPCFTQFPTIANLLDTANVSWRYYADRKGFDILYNPFSAIQYVRYGQDWKRNLRVPAAKVLTDLKKGRIAAVSWVLSPLADSDFPGNGGGPQWVNSLVRATEKSPYWKHTAIVVIWDDSGDGNFYDNVAPPQLDVMGLGFRVPMLVVSPYAKRGYVSHTPYEFGSILKFAEENWDLGSLDASDRRANSISDVFDFTR